MLGYIDNLSFVPLRELAEDEVEIIMQLNLIMMQALKESYNKSAMESL